MRQQAEVGTQGHEARPRCITRLEHGGRIAREQLQGHALPGKQRRRTLHARRSHRTGQLPLLVRRQQPVITRHAQVGIERITGTDVAHAASMARRVSCGGDLGIVVIEFLQRVGPGVAWASD
jgi:hypothetical protein